MPGSFSNVDPIININDRVAKIKTSNVQIEFSNEIMYTSPSLLVRSAPNFPFYYQLLDEEDIDIGLGAPGSNIEFIYENDFSIPIDFNFIVKTNLQLDNPDTLDLLY